MPIEQKPMTVGDLKKAIADLPDEMPLVSYDNFFCELCAASSLPHVASIVEISLDEGVEVQFMLSEEFEMRQHWFPAKPIMVRKLNALHM